MTHRSAEVLKQAQPFDSAIATRLIHGALDGLRLPGGGRYPHMLPNVATEWRFRNALVRTPTGSRHRLYASCKGRGIRATAGAGAERAAPRFPA